MSSMIWSMTRSARHDGTTWHDIYDLWYVITWPIIYDILWSMRGSMTWSIFLAMIYCLWHDMKWFMIYNMILSMIYDIYMSVTWHDLWSMTWSMIYVTIHDLWHISFYDKTMSLYYVWNTINSIISWPLNHIVSTLLPIQLRYIVYTNIDDLARNWHSLRDKSDRLHETKTLRLKYQVINPLCYEGALRSVSHFGGSKLPAWFSEPFRKNIGQGYSITGLIIQK